MSRNERMEKLTNANINTGKYFTVDLPEGLPAGAKISLVIDENGVPVIDPVAQQIVEDGYVKNTKLHRRFVMAQMFKMLNFYSYNGRFLGYNEALKRHPYQYTFTMMLEEVRVLSKLEGKDAATFAERSSFFTKDVVAQVVEDYVEKLKNYLECLPERKCKGVPYKRIKGRNVFVDDFNKVFYRPANMAAVAIRHAKNYAEAYKILAGFMKYDMIKLPYETTKSKVWVDTYKGEGAFYTLKNLVMYHGCYIEADFGDKPCLYGVSAMSHLNKKLDEYRGQGWRMFGLMKKVIADNNFSFRRRMAEIYGE